MADNTIAWHLSPLSASTPGYDLNPRCRALFPWLSTVAGNFELYKFVDLKFNFVSSQPTTAAGRYYVAVDVDYDDSLPTSAPTMMANAIKASAPVWESISLTVPSGMMHRDMEWKYVLTPHRVDPEPRTSYCGFLLAAFQGLMAGCELDLWVEYTVELKNPTSDEGTYLNALSGTDRIDCPAITQLGAFGCTGALPIVSGVQIPGVSVVRTGQGGVPSFTLNTVKADQAWDISQFLGNEMDVVSEVLETGVTPANVMLKNPSPVLGVFDSLGNLLTQAEQLLGGYTAITPNDPVTVNTAGAALKAIASFSLPEILKHYPSARYLVPFLSTAAAMGAGKARASMKGWI